MGDLGRLMCKLPLDPMYAKAIITAGEVGCVEEMISIVSALSVDSLFFSPAKERQRADAARMKFASPDGDHLTLLAVISGHDEAKGTMEWCKDNFVNKRNVRKVKDMTKQLHELCGKFKIRVSSCGDELEPLLKCIAGSFFIHAAELQPDGTYVTLVGRQQCHIHPSSVLFKKKPQLVIYDELMLTQKRYMHSITSIQPAWLAEMAP